MKRLIVVITAAMLASLIGWAPAEARTCPPASVGGPAVAHITVGSTKVPVKRITFRNGGPLDPPHTNQAAGISARNAPLHAKHGATVITWHVRYGFGCDGTLNALTALPVGANFTVRAVGKPATTFQITSRTTVPKGVIKRWWFRMDGPHRLVLITCDDLSGGVFHRTMTIVAKPLVRKGVPPLPYLSIMPAVWPASVASRDGVRQDP
jgi:hypothetical protein